MRIKSATAATKLRNRIRTDSPVCFEHIKEKVPMYPSVQGQETIGEVVFDKHSPGVFVFGGRVIIKNSSIASVVNLTPEVATLGIDGRINIVSEGTLKLRHTYLGVTKYIDIPLVQTLDGLPVYTFSSVLPGSLATHMSAQIDSRITTEMTKEANGYLYSTQNHGAAQYVRNPNFWAKTIDFTCVSPWNSTGGTCRSGTLVTPRHIIFAAHYQLHTGATIRFVDANNVVTTRTMVAKVSHPSADFTIGVLNSNVPSGINFCSVLPANWFSYISQANLGYTKIPSIGLDQFEFASIQELSSDRAFSITLNHPRNIFTSMKITGDSGSPMFLVVNDSLVLVTVLTYGSAGSGSSICSNIASLNQMISQVDTLAGISTGYTLTQANFSSFPTY